MIDSGKLTQVIGALEEDRLNELLDQFIASNPGVEETREALEACQRGMARVGECFEAGEYFVGDLLFAGELLINVIEKLKPLLRAGGAEGRGVIVLGTVEGDIHDIGKTIFKGMAEAGGFTVVDIGIDQAPAAFVAAVQAHNPRIVGLSGILSASVNAMIRTVDALRGAGLRDALRIIIGGAAVSAEACAAVGADGWSKNAAEAVRLCGTWVNPALYPERPERERP